MKIIEISILFKLFPNETRAINKNIPICPLSWPEPDILPRSSSTIVPVGLILVVRVADIT